MKPFDFWTDQQANTAIDEGWLLTNDSKDRVTIARLDDPKSVAGLSFTEPVFDDDAEANEFVVSRALVGSKTHMLAVFLQGYNVDDDLQVWPWSLQLD